MTLLITLFVGIQLFFGFLALVYTVRNAPEGFDDDTGFHLARCSGENNRTGLTDEPTRCSPALHLRGQVN